jgi:hypothetical protein
MTMDIEIEGPVDDLEALLTADEDENLLGDAASGGPSSLC